MDERHLVAQILNGDQRAYGVFINTYKRLVGHMIYRLIDDERDREELCQDVFMKVFDKLATFKFDSKLSTWVATVAYRIALNHLRKQKRAVDEQDLDTVSFSLGREDVSVESRDFAQFVQQLIMQMPVHYRTVLTLYYLEGFSYPEIVEVTQMPEGTVKNYLFRAKSKLKELSMPYIGQEIDDL